MTDKEHRKATRKQNWIFRFLFFGQFGVLISIIMILSHVFPYNKEELQISIGLFVISITSFLIALYSKDPFSTE